MVLLTATCQILDAISLLPPSAAADLSENPDPLPTSSSDPISHETLIALSRLPLKDGSTLSLNKLLRGTKVYVPLPAPKPEPSPEYVALMARLRQEQEQREYAALLPNRRGGSFAAGDMDEEEDSISPSFVLNMLISVIVCAGAVFQLTKWWSNDGIRVLFSLGTSIAVGCAEVGIYAIYLNKVKSARIKEKEKKEKKVFIGEYHPDDAKDEDSVRSISEKEEIWGKGINGGMRRRVREKWEKEQKDNHKP